MDKTQEAVVRPMPQMPAGPDYWPVPLQPTVVHRPESAS